MSRVVDFYLERYRNPETAYRKYSSHYKDDIEEGVVRNPATLQDFQNSV